MARCSRSPTPSSRLRQYEAARAYKRIAVLCLGETGLGVVDERRPECFVRLWRERTAADEGAIAARIHIVGASGSGTTALPLRSPPVRSRHLDRDEFYWMPTSPPFRVTRLRRSDSRFSGRRCWRRTPGSCRESSGGWGDPCIPTSTGRVLAVPTEVRLEASGRARSSAMESRHRPRGRLHAPHLESSSGRAATTRVVSRWEAAFSTRPGWPPHRCDPAPGG